MRGNPRCPICRKPARWHGNSYRPFCSDRCHRLDLGNWASERYAIPGEPGEPGEEFGEGKPVDPAFGSQERHP